MFESKYNKLLTIVLVIVIIAIIGLLVFWGIDVFQKSSITNETAEFVDNYQGDDQTPDDETENNENDGSNPLDEIEESNTTGSSKRTKKSDNGYVVNVTLEIPYIYCNNRT
mgnify:CR=1 FL=1